MSRLGGAFWFILVVASGMTNFLVKQTVQGLDEQLNAVKKKTVAEQKAIHALNADWTFFNQPELLADLNNRYVHLGALAPRQVIASADALPLRPAPPPMPEPPPLVMLPPPVVLVASAPPPPPIVPIAVSQPTHMPAPQPVPILAVAAGPPVRMPAPPAVPIVPAAAIQPVHGPTAPPPAAPPRPAKPASLDGLFAQVTGDR